MWSHCLVTSHYRINDYSIPPNFKQYQRKEALKNNLKKFQDKQQLAIELISEFTPATKTNYLLVDSWYTSAKILLHGLVNGCHGIGRIKKLKTLGDTISYFCNDYLVQMVSFEYTCVDNGISLDSVISQLGLVA